MDVNTLQLVDAYHEFALTTVNDIFARMNIHGLNPIMFEGTAFDCEYELIQHFLKWLSPKKYSKLYGHAPEREIKSLNINIEDLKLPCWAERDSELFHTFANQCKMEQSIFCGRRCIQAYHSCFCRNLPSNTVGQIARNKHGYHCAFYDCYELYLYYLLGISI